MKISFEIPSHFDEAIEHVGGDVSQLAKEAFLIVLYRQERITHYELATALNISKLAAIEVMARHQVTWGPSVEEMQEEVTLLQKGGEE